MDRHAFPQPAELHRAFVDLGDRYRVQDPVIALRHILSADDLRTGVWQALGEYGIRIDEHGRNRPTYKVCRGKRWEAYCLWRDRARELSAAWHRLAWLRTMVNAYPDETFREFASWSDLVEVQK